MPMPCDDTAALASCQPHAASTAAAVPSATLRAQVQSLHIARSPRVTGWAVPSLSSRLETTSSVLSPDGLQRRGSTLTAGRLNGDDLFAACERGIAAFPRPVVGRAALDDYLRSTALDRIHYEHRPIETLEVERLSRKVDRYGMRANAKTCDFNVAGTHAMTIHGWTDVDGHENRLATDAATQLVSAVLELLCLIGTSAQASGVAVVLNDCG